MNLSWEIRTFKPGQKSIIEILIYSLLSQDPEPPDLKHLPEGLSTLDVDWLPLSRRGLASPL